jgi:hypothetical protein
MLTSSLRIGSGIGIQLGEMAVFIIWVFTDTQYEANRNTTIQNDKEWTEAPETLFLWTSKVAKQWQNSFYAIERNIRKSLILKHCLAWI